MPDTRELIGQLNDPQPNLAYKACFLLEQKVSAATAPGLESERASMAAEIAKHLNLLTPASKDEQGRDIPPHPQHPAHVRNKLARMLAIVGQATEVPALAEAMNDLDVREAARCALESIPGPEATAALVAAYGLLGPEFQIGVVSSLGRRGAVEAVATLAEAVKHDHKEVRCAALDALARIPVAANDQVLSEACGCKCAKTAAEAWRARVRLADTLLAHGQAGAAQAIFKTVAATGTGPQQHAAKAALQAV